MQTEIDDDLYGGQRSSEVKCGKLCDMVTIFGQNNHWCKLGMMMTFMEVKANRSQIQWIIFVLPLWYLVSRWGLGSKVCMHHFGCGNGINWIKGYYMIVKVKIETFWFSTYSMEMHSLTSSSFIICLWGETFGSRTILLFKVRILRTKSCCNWGSKDPGEGSQIYETGSMNDHNFIKHPLNEDFFHAKMTPETGILAFFFQNFTPKQGFAQNFTPKSGRIL